MNICVIPMLSGSTRVEDKNIRLLNGLPPVHYSLTEALKAGVFDRIYVFTDIEVVKDYVRSHFDNPCVQILDRLPDRGGVACKMEVGRVRCNGTRCQSHSHYLYDVLCRTGIEDDDWLWQLHTTSPFLSAKTIHAAMFARNMVAENGQIQGVTKIHKECRYNSEPLNYCENIKVPTQELRPVQEICWALTGWRVGCLARHIEFGTPMETSFYEVPRIDALDIDTEDDWLICEAVAANRKRTMAPFYLKPEHIGIETEVDGILSRDGNGIQTALLVESLEETSDEPSAQAVAINDVDQVTVITDTKFSKCRLHCHPTHDEWWHVVYGAFRWDLYDPTGTTIVQSKTVLSGGFARVPAGVPHQITCLSEVGKRIAAGKRDFAHVYFEEPTK